MRNDLLSIGEVAKLKGVGAKALRYYERIGILPPAFVDERTGYRYYDLRQMSEIDVIAACIELGIPLKKLNAYRSEQGMLDIATLLEHGRTLAEEQLRKSQANLLQVDAYRTEIALQRRCRDAAAPYTRTLEPRSLLALPWEGASFDARRYVRGMTELYDRARLLGLVPLYVVGMARLPRDDDECGCCSWSVVLEVQALPDAETPAELLVLPGGDYRGARIVGNSFEECFNVVLATASTLDGLEGPVLAHEVWDDELRADRFVLEVLSLRAAESFPSSP